MLLFRYVVVILWSYLKTFSLFCELLFAPYIHSVHHLIPSYA